MAEGAPVERSLPERISFACVLVAALGLVAMLFSRKRRWPQVLIVASVGTCLTTLEILSKPAIDVTVDGMAKELVPDDLWEVIEPLLPPEPPKPKGGRPRVDNRAALTGIIFVLKSGIPWEMLPQEMGCGSGVTCWRRLREWQEASVWERLHQVLLDRLGEADQIEWERAALEAVMNLLRSGLLMRKTADRQ